MRRKSVRRLKATVSRCTPIVVQSEDVNDDAVPYSDSDGDLEDDRMAGSNDKMTDCMKENSNGSPMVISSHDLLCIDILDRNICLGCNEGGEVLVCSEIGCPVSLHSKCISCEPSFDNMGNFYCPYCQYKRAVVKVNELKNKALIEKKALSKILGKNEVTGDKMSQKNGTVKRAEHQEVPHTGVKDFLDGCNRKGCNDVQSRPLRTAGGQERENIEADYPRHIDEDFHETNLESREEEESLNTSPFRALTMKGIEHDEDVEEIHQEEPRVPAIDRSVSEIINSYSYSRGVSPRERCFKNGANRIAYPQMFDSDRESTLQRKTSGTNACYQNLEVTLSGRLREHQGLSKQVTRETHAKRKRLLWTTEEENMLKEGVSRFSTQNHNIPWRKILEYGSNVLDSTRTPVDLKDKWRNITAKKVGSDTREQKRSTCSSYPYINSRPSHTSSPDETDDTGILHLSSKADGSSIVANRFSNDSPSITKSGSTGFQRKWYKKCVNLSTTSSGPEFISASLADLLSGLYCIGVDCMFPIEDKNFDLVEKFFCRYRMSHYKEEPESENKKETKSENKNQVGFTCLFLKFAPVVSVPSKEDLLATFSQFGPLKESDMQLLKDTGIAQIVFANCSDAGDAFCSVVQNKPFGTTLIDCKLHRPTSHLPREKLVTSAQPSGGSELRVVNYSMGTDMAIRHQLDRLVGGPYNPIQKLMDCRVNNATFTQPPRRSESCVVNYAARTDMTIRHPLDKLVGGPYNPIQKLMDCRVNNCSAVDYRQSVCPSGSKSLPSEAPSVDFIKQKLQMMTLMLEKSGDTLSLQMRIKLEDEIKHLMSKVNSMTCSSSDKV